MNYRVRYACWSHAGKCRKLNQDNFICDGRFMDEGAQSLAFPLVGYVTPSHPALMGVFDGMGGEECGEVASFIAAKTALDFSFGENPLEDLQKICKEANEKICAYAAENDVMAMGTTAAFLAFADAEIFLCNIGDSKIFRFADGGMEQISVDHCAFAAYGAKQPLSQNLGIPASEMEIDPYMAKGFYNDGDVYLICSDGLTDMVAVGDIAKILSETAFNESVNRLLNAALENGGKDNITILLCRVEREKRGLFGKIFRLKSTVRGEKSSEK